MSIVYLEKEGRMGIKIKKIKLLVCDRCKHEWKPKKANPLLCPACKSRFWNIGKKKNKRLWKEVKIRK